MVEAEKFLKSYNQRGQTRKYSFPQKSTFRNKYSEKVEEVEKADVDKILIENINTKEGLKAIVTELLKRRIENIKNQN